MKYFYGWDDACWTEAIGDEDRPMRFESVQEGQIALEVMFAHVKEAVASGDMDIEENPDDYRIVEACV